MIDDGRKNQSFLKTINNVGRDTVSVETVKMGLTINEE